MKYVCEILEKKGRDIWSVALGSPVYGRAALDGREELWSGSGAG